MSPRSMGNYKGIFTICCIDQKIIEKIITRLIENENKETRLAKVREENKIYIFSIVCMLQCVHH